MPRAQEDQLVLDVDLDAARRAVLEAAAADGWRVVSDSDARITVKEVVGHGPATTFPAEVRLNLVSAPGTPRTLIQLDGFGVGLGRIQRGHLYARVGALRQAILACSQRQQPREPLADELRELAQMRERGTISEEEFAAAKARLLGS